MEDVYTIKVRTKPDTRNLYPSERRYSASTVSGLAWVHIALAATSFLLACLALVNHTEDAGIVKRLEINQADLNSVTSDDDFLKDFETTTEEYIDENATEIPILMHSQSDNGYILVVASSLLTIFALSAGIASIMASVRWYVDHNITWLFIMSVLSTLLSLVSFIMVLVWFITTSAATEDLSDIYKDKNPFNYYVVKHSDIIDKNNSHVIVALNTTNTIQENESHTFTKKVLSVNILIAAFLEILWSILSVKIAYKGMRSHYKEEEERPGNCVEVVTTIKGNDTKNLPNKILPTKPGLIENYPNKKIKRIFLAQGDNGFYLKNQNSNDKNSKQNTETSSELYKERMMNFLNGCTVEAASNPEVRNPSVQSENVQNIPEINIQDTTQDRLPQTPLKDRMTPISWGDTPEHTIYNQNNINFDDIFKFGTETEATSEMLDKNKLC